jgi:hypothetical protein
VMGLTPSRDHLIEHAASMDHARTLATAAAMLAGAVQAGPRVLLRARPQLTITPRLRRGGAEHARTPESNRVARLGLHPPHARRLPYSQSQTNLPAPLPEDCDASATITVKGTAMVSKPNINRIFRIGSIPLNGYAATMCRRVGYLPLGAFIPVSLTPRGC